MTRIKRIAGLAAMLLLSIATHSQAVLTTVFNYNFPASYNGTGTTVTDLGPAANHGVTSGVLALSSNIPVGAPAGTSSLNLVATPGRINTNAIDLITNASVAASGGFVYDFWFNPTGTNTGGIKKIIDMAGTDLVAYDTNTVPRVTIGLSDMGETAFYTGGGLDPNGWNHVVVEFNSDGSQLIGNVVAGKLSVTVNGITQNFGAKTVGNFGNSLNRTIGIGQHPLGGEQFNGLIYNPTAFLGNTGLSALPTPVANYRLDEIANPSNGATAFDSSGNNRNGIYLGGSGGPITGQPTAPGFGTGASFNGTTDVVNLGVQPAFQLGNNFTIAALITPDVVTGRHRIFSEAGAYGFGVDNNQLIFTTYGRQDFITNLANLVAGQTYHVAVAFDTLNDAYFYVDGQLVQVVAGALPALINTANPHFIGSNNGTTEMFDGTIGNLWFFNERLTQTQINSLRTPEGAAAVPEPASLSLIGLAAIAMLRRRGRAA